MGRPAKLLLCLGIALCAGGTLAAPTPATPEGLRAKHAELQERLRSNDFGRPLHLDSEETANDVRGDIHAVLSHPFTAVAPALEHPAHWCEILLLHMNTKQCAAEGAERGTVTLRIGRKHDSPPDQSHEIAFSYRVLARTADYLQVRLDAKQGPLSTRDYRIVLEVIPLDAGRSFMHLAYSYGFGFSGRFAMQTYLNTVGRDKVGFTVTGRDASGTPRYVDGMRGVVERNTIRYYLAIDAFLGARSAPPAQRVEKSLRDWFAATERYPRQLREISEAEYLAAKRQDYARHAQSGQRPTGA